MEDTKQGLNELTNTINLLTFFLFISYCLIALLFYFIFYADNTSADKTQELVSAAFTIKEDDIVYGNEDSDVVIFEYSDLECPFCRQFHSTLMKFTEEKNIAWVYRHLPLPELGHQTAKEGSVIAECIKERDSKTNAKAFIDASFRNAAKPSLSYYRSLALTESNLSKEILDECLNVESEEYKNVNDSRSEANFLGLNGTPNGAIVNTKKGIQQKIPGAISATDLETIYGLVK